MKKRLMLLACFLLLLHPARAEAAGPVNTAIHERLTPAGEDGLLAVEWTGRPDEQGNIFLPNPPGGPVWTQTEAVGATVASARPLEVTVAGRKLLEWQATSGTGEMTLRVWFLLPHLFAPPEARSDPEGGPTRRGDLRSLTYTFENTLSAPIAAYSFTAELPSGTEVHLVRSPKGYTVSTGQILVSLAGKPGGFALLPGQSVTVDLDYLPAGSAHGTLWAGIALLAAALLIFRRKLLSPASGGCES